MRANLILVALAGLLLSAAGMARGQGALQKVEDKIGRTPPASSPAPGSGYLGGEFDTPMAGPKGVLVNRVRTNSPAELGGLKANDLITAVNGKPIGGMPDFDAILDNAIPGQKLRMAVSRGGRSADVVITLGVRPADPATTGQPGEPPGPGATAPPATLPSTGSSPAPALPNLSPALGSPSPERPGPGGAFSPRPTTSTDDGVLPPPATGDAGTGTGSLRSRPFDSGAPPATVAPPESTPGAAAEEAPESAFPGSAPPGSGGPSLGITVDALTDDARQAYGLTVRRGAFITAVRQGSPADRAGLPIGGVVVALDGRRIDSADDLVTAVRAAQPGQEIELGYYDGTRFGRKTIKLAPASATAAPGSLPRLGGGLAGGAMPATDRPLIGRVERSIDGFAPGGGGAMTMFDPTAFAALQREVVELTATVKKLEERLRALEGNRGTTGSSPPAPVFTPGFGSAPVGPATPGFVPGLAAPGTNP